MKRIGWCLWTWRPLKGTSRAIRQREWRKFRITAAIVNETAAQVAPVIHKAYLDSLIWGHSAVAVSWNPDTEKVEVVNEPMV